MQWRRIVGVNEDDEEDRMDEGRSFAVATSKDREENTVRSS